MNNLNKYGQAAGRASDIWFRNFCTEIDENTQGIPEAIKELENRILGRFGHTKQASKSTIPFEERWTEENIDKAFAENRENIPPKRFNKEEFIENKILYKRVLTQIQSYYEKNEQTMDSHDKFYLSYFFASMNNRLENYKSTIQYDEDLIRILNKALETQEEWAKNLNQTDIPKALKDKRHRHEIKSEGPVLQEKLQETTISLEEALASKSYLEKGLISSFQEILGFFKSLRTTEFSSLILQVNALDALEHDRFAIFFLQGKTDTAGQVGSGGGYYIRSRTTIKSEYEGEFFSETKGTLLHELTHKAMERIFNNNCCPYAKDDVDAKKTYRECIRQILINAVDATIPLNELEKLAYNTDHEVVISYKYSRYKPKINFPHPWNKSLPLNKLVENCFGPNGIIWLVSQQLKNGDKMTLNGQEIKIDKNNADFFQALVHSLSMVFGVCGESGPYGPETLDVEFITNVSDKVLYPGFNDNKIIKPLMDYIEEYVNPEMKKYINEHPAKEKIILNESHFNRLFNNIGWLLTNKASLTVICSMILLMFASIIRRIIGI